MANPDGYVYSWTTDRLWLKNRRTFSNSDCSGVNLNRNWDIFFQSTPTDDPCTSYYKGPEAFSEPETVALKNQITHVNTTSDLRLVMALHSYGQSLLYPYSYTFDPAPNTDEMIAAGKKFAKAAKKVNNTRYKVTNTNRGFIFNMGSMEDWTKSELETPYVYTLQLPDKGKYKYELPASHIQGTVAEIAMGFKKLTRHVFKD